MDYLFRAASGAIIDWCKEQGFLPGITAVLHTFGSTLNFHPHIHILLTLGGLSKNDNFDFDVWQDNSFFPEKYLKTEFKRLLLKCLRKSAKEKLLKIPYCIKQIWWKKFKKMDFYSVSQELWSIIWYVYIGERLDNAEYTAKYIGRYAKRPCMSETNITDYNPETKTVAFTYRDKISKTDKCETVSAEEFIGRIIRHIPEKHFRMIRYYGLYANCVKNQLMPILLYQISILFSIARLKFSPSEQPQNWRERIIQLTGNDPLLCPYCNEQMELNKIVYRARDGTFKTVDIF